MAIADASGLPVAVDIQSASPHEIKLVEATIKSRFIKKAPRRMIGDKAYDSDPMDQRLLKEHGTELIAPHKANRKRPKTQDGRALRRYKRRWKIVQLQKTCGSLGVSCRKLSGHVTTRMCNYPPKVFLRWLLNNIIS
jgi:hypothetical protein